MNRISILAICAMPLVLGCTGKLEPYGEALMIVDTDAALKLTGRLRIDVFSESGEWLQSRDLLTSDALDWPVSFSVQASAEEQRRTLVRLRTYPTGRVRDYRGERYRPKPIWDPPVPPTSVEEMCDTPEVVRPGEARWVRVGKEGFVRPYRWCDTMVAPEDLYTPVLGSNALALEIDEPAVYRITVAGHRPEAGGDSVQEAPGPFLPVTLHVQQNCGLPEPVTSETDGLPACPPRFSLETQRPLDPDSAIERTLAPGRYHILLGAIHYAPVEVAIGVTKVDDWDDFVERVPDLLSPRSEREPGGRLPLANGASPQSEPDPLATIDRLVLLELEPGRVSSARITLRAACFGAMAQLRADWPYQPPLIDEARTCTHVEGELVAVEPFPLDPDLSIPEASDELDSAFTQETCDGSDTSDRVCVPGGVFLFGDQDLPGNGEQTVSPERVALMSRFWIDRREVTGGDYRAALASGFESVDPPVGVDAPVEGDRNYPERACNWTRGAGEAPTDDQALTCVSWSEARAYCRFMGGDLPTAAQWEYVATAANRDEETLFPWGNDVPECSQDACEDTEGPCHAIHADRFDSCEGDDAPTAPVSADSYADPEHGDVSVPLNDDPDAVVFGLAGGVSELTLDALYPYDSDCWQAADLIDPVCVDRHAVFRELRGGSWARPLTNAIGTSRSAAISSDNVTEGAPWPPGPQVFNWSQGFRCVYSEAP